MTKTVAGASVPVTITLALTKQSAKYATRHGER